MKLIINGRPKEFAGVTLAELIDHLGLKSDRVAVAVNRDIVPVSNWGVSELKEGDQVEIVHFVSGGN